MQVKRYRKKPVVVKAVEWTGDNLEEVIEFSDGRDPKTGADHVGMPWEEYQHLVQKDGLKIYTLEGTMLADVGDFIIRGVQREFYPCKPDIFKASYEEVD